MSIQEIGSALLLIGSILSLIGVMITRRKRGTVMSMPMTVGLIVLTIGCAGVAFDWRYHSLASPIARDMLNGACLFFVAAIIIGTISMGQPTQA